MQRFDLATAPLMRVVVARVGPSRSLLLIVIHHLVMDGWSNGVLVRDLFALYQSMAHGKTPVLPHLELSYFDWAAR